MIAHLRGRLLSLTPEEAVLEVGGVGYQLQIPLSTYYHLEGLQRGGLQRGGGQADQDVALFVYTHVREDTISLFGFTSPDERRLFERLIGVSGIGPKLGRVILSGLAPGDLVAALESGDAARLATTPGVGKKTAERMILELRDKVADLRSGPTNVAPRPTSPDDDLMAALESLGYRLKEAERAVAAVAEEAPDAELGVRLRLALKQLSKI